MEKRGRPASEKNLIKRKFREQGWRQVRGDSDSYTISFPERKRTLNANDMPRLIYSTTTKVLNIYYPYKADKEIIVHLTRQKIDRELKDILHPSKWLTVVTREYASNSGRGTWNCNYTVDYYCIVGNEPSREEIERIFAICEAPITEE